MMLNLYNRVAHDKQHGHLFIQDGNDFKGLEASIFEKFPRRCSVCGAKHCECNIIFVGGTDERTREAENKAKEKAKNELSLARMVEKAPKTIDEYELMFADIYGQGHRVFDH